MLWSDCGTLLEVRVLIPVSDNWVSRSKMGATLNTPTHGGSGAGGTANNAGRGIPRVWVAAVRVGMKIQISVPREPSEVDMVPIGARVIGYSETGHIVS
ncbi:hypothetical protein DPMN_034337 [Dreissena polymorpha]|uniref:Uncharacterized protein n=1 Tax=Dreissena polymorpha TaxID=45954 RepID=A0A9D4M7D8_DREPO|nr:hypothetical protein DPMN_034337 [Dreissena polymorpha]